MAPETEAPPLPAVVGLDDVEILEPGSWPGGIRLARLITKGTTGSDVLLGVCWLEPGESTTFDLTDPGHRPTPAQETYFVVRGRIRVQHADGTFEAGPDQAIWFAPGRRYEVKAVGDAQAYVVYTVSPAPR